MPRKFIIYQILLRVFGNKNDKCVSNGSLFLNGSGKFGSVSEEVLSDLKKLSVTHVWYTGCIEHATGEAFSSLGIKRDNIRVVKGRAGSPFAIKDYYDVNPYLADNPAERMSEFENMVRRTHDAGLKVIIDFIPNHLARQYDSDGMPSGCENFGESDDTEKAFSPDNNFYYLTGKNLDLSRIPEPSYGEKESESEPYWEFPAKATGNDCFSESPGPDDWYETVKLNYGVDYLNGRNSYFDPVPKTWKMMSDVLEFWTEKGVDGFRCDMAGMVPVEFWHYAIRKTKKSASRPLLFIGEIYDPSLYRSYRDFGGFDYLYDKVGLYDTLRSVSGSFMPDGMKPAERKPAESISGCWQSLGNMKDSMLNFLENHDEQRIASDFNLVNPFRAVPELTVSLMLDSSPFMLYFGQEFGERGMSDSGFGKADGRTSIYDFCSAPVVAEYFSALANGVKEEFFDFNELYHVYRRLLAVAMNERAIRSGYLYDLEYCNKGRPYFDGDREFVFARRSCSCDSLFDAESFGKKGKDCRDSVIFVSVDFSMTKKKAMFFIPRHFFDFWNIRQGEYELTDVLDPRRSMTFILEYDRVVTLPYDKYGISIFKFEIDSGCVTKA
ncbi:MAG: alpha-amylase family glycosyl hydrolase [Bacteroidales bacterium]|jgi:glycosidase|nr:alpha-amylase family glycosyl hydrolase [Bacteroidales bacterium]